MLIIEAANNSANRFALTQTIGHPLKTTENAAQDMHIII
jgi:hypothetical protein